MKLDHYVVKMVVLTGIFGVLLFGGNARALASSPEQDVTPPESQTLDLTAESLGWSERTNGGTMISHSVTSGDLTVKSLIKWEYTPVSNFVYAGNIPGIPFGETQGYEGHTGCTLAGDCYPFRMEYFSFNFDMNTDGDGDLDTPPERYLRLSCEVSNIPTTPRDVEEPDGDAMELCTTVLEMAIRVRDGLQIPACVGVVCPYSACDGTIHRYDGSCDPQTGRCIFASSEDCGALGCDVGTGQCRTSESDMCSNVVCEPAVCMDGESYYDPVCNPADGVCEYVVEDCGAAGCDPDTGRCNQSLCGGIPCEPAQCLDNQSFYDPVCVDGECQYSLEDCGTSGCNPDTGRCNQTSPDICGGSMGLVAVGFLLLAVRVMRST